MTQTTSSVWNKTHKAECAAAARRYRKAHPDRVRKGKQKHDKANRATIREYMRKWHAAHPDTESTKRRVRAWQKANPEKRRANNHKRRGRRIGSWTAAEWLTLKKQYGYRCVACWKTEDSLAALNRVIVPDHIIPLAKGGLNTIENLQPLCHGNGGCNNRKGVRVQDFVLC